MKIIKIAITSILFNYMPFVFSNKIKNRSFKNIEFYKKYTPYNEGYLQVSELHKIYYSEFGNPTGIPVIVVHGGPGAGCSDDWSSFFDSSFYRVIMFDQRGAGRSTPHAEMKENTPQLLIEDMEKLRKYLKIDKWILCGGSWGSALSILYGETYPELALGFVLRGIFLARKKDYENLFYGMKKTFPEAWQEMAKSFSKEEQSDLILNMHKKVMDDRAEIHMPAAHAFMKYDTICATLLPNQELVKSQAEDDKSTLSIARSFIHYSINNFFLEEDQLLANIEKISHLPAIFVHGRYDIICPAETAYELHTQWKNSELWFINDAGHSTSDSSLAFSLKKAMDKMKIRCSDVYSSSSNPDICSDLSSLKSS